MLEFLSLIFTDYTLRTVALGAAVLGIVGGVMSVFAVLRKQSLLGDAVAHAALPGVVIAFILTGSKAIAVLMGGAIISGWLGALLVMVIVRYTRIKEDSALGVVLAVFFGFGLVLLTWVQRHGSASQSGLDKFLFGQAAALVVQDVLVMAITGAVVLLTVVLLWKEFKLLTFDAVYTASLGFPARGLDVLLTTLIVVAIVIGLQTVGVVLMSAVIVAPGAAARQWTDKLGVMTVLAASFGALAGVSGALLSASTPGLPTGPTIVVILSLIVILSLLFAPNRGYAWTRLRQRRNRHTLRTAAVLETLYVMGVQHGDPRHPHELRSLQAAIPGRGIRYTLGQLVAQGFVASPTADTWALTDAGVDQARTLLAATGYTSATLQPDAQPLLS